MRNAVIVDVVRTASGRGKLGGALFGVHPASLLASTIESLVKRNGIDPGVIEDVMAGCVTQASDQALNIARTAALAAGLPDRVPGVTIERQCGSSQQAAVFAAQGVMTGMYDVVVACGVESMSRVPMFSQVGDGVPNAPLAQRYPQGLPSQGYGAEMMAERWGLSRAEIDEFAARSHFLAADAADSGFFDNEIIPVTTSSGVHDKDQTIRRNTTTEGLGTLPSAFHSDEMAAQYPTLGGTSLQETPRLSPTAPRRR